MGDPSLLDGETNRAQLSPLSLATLPATLRLSRAGSGPRSEGDIASGLRHPSAYGIPPRVNAGPHLTKTYHEEWPR